jgi:hypothetical protein
MEVLRGKTKVPEEKGILFPAFFRTQDATLTPLFPFYQMALKSLDLQGLTIT